MLKIESPKEIIVSALFKEKLDRFIQFLYNYCIIRPEVKSDSSVICQEYRKYLRESGSEDVSSSYINFMMSTLGLEGRCIYGVRPISSYKLGEHRYLTSKELDERNGEDVMIKHSGVNTS